MKNEKSFLFKNVGLGQDRAEAISAIEGQKLTFEQRKRLDDWGRSGLSSKQQRAEIMRHYLQGPALK